MKNLTRLIIVTITLLASTLVYAEKVTAGPKEGRLFSAEKVTAGPKGGRLLELEGAFAEFLVEKDRTAMVAFYDTNLKSVAATNQSVTVIAETKEGKKKIEFEKKGDSLVSKIPLPDGNGYNVVLQLKTSSDAKVKNFRIPLNTEMCGGCKHPEYACTCENH
jgi:hypothetical protein